MTKTAAPTLTPSSARVASRGSKKTAKNNSSDYQANPGAITLGLAVNMGWQLAIVVLMPILGGHFLDAHSKAGSAWTIGGVVLAMGGMIVVVRQTLQQLNDAMQSSDQSNDQSNHGEPKE